jgi:hypothetical protein
MIHFVIIIVCQAQGCLVYYISIEKLLYQYCLSVSFRTIQNGKTN